MKIEKCVLSDDCVVEINFDDKTMILHSLNAVNNGKKKLKFNIISPVSYELVIMPGSTVTEKFSDHQSTKDISYNIKAIKKTEGSLSVEAELMDGIAWRCSVGV